VYVSGEEVGMVVLAISAFLEWRHVRAASGRAPDLSACFRHGVRQNCIETSELRKYLNLNQE
jgi:hypothetical protein